MSYEYSENILVQESAGDLLQHELGWRVVFAYNEEKLGENGTFGRTSYKEVLLHRYFREALQKLNPWITPTQIDEAVQKFTATLSTSSLLQINEEKYGFIRDGIPVSYKKPDGTSDVYFVYCLLKDKKTELDSLQKGAAQPHVYAKDINALATLIPPEEMLKLYTKYASPYFEKVKVLKEQIKNLTQSRDRLLPKLMNGELDV